MTLNVCSKNVLNKRIYRNHFTQKGNSKTEKQRQSNEKKMGRPEKEKGRSDKQSRLSCCPLYCSIVSAAPGHN